MDAVDIAVWVIYLLSLYFTVFWIMVFIDKRNLLKEEDANKKRPRRYPQVSVVIPAYNEEKTIAETMESVLGLNYPSSRLQLIVVNDGSKDGTLKEIKKVIKAHPGRDILCLDQKNQGKAKSLNDALAILKGEYFACLDADSFVDKETLKKMVFMFQKGDPKLAIVTPAMRIKEPNNLIQKFQRVEYIVAMFIHRLMGHLDSIYVAPGPFSLYKTEVIRKLGGFEVGNLVEDQEIAYRVQKHHYRLRQCPDGYVFTIGPDNMKGFYKQRNRWFKGSILNIFKYKNIIMNKKYGDFGVVMMPLNMASFFLSIGAVFFFFYFTFYPLLQEFHRFSLIGFDIMPYLADFTFKYNFLDIALGRVFVAYILLLIAVIVFVLAHRNADEQFGKYGWMYLIPYFFIYYIFLAFISIVVLVELVVGKRQKW